MFKKIDKFLPEKYVSDVEEIVKDLPMYYSMNTSYAPEDKNFNFWNDQMKTSTIVDNGQFTHAVYHQGEIFSKYYGLIYPMLYLFAEKANIVVNEIVRIKINLLLRDKTFTEENYNFPHSDRDGKYVFLYYINDSDGDTVLFNEFDNLKTVPSNFNIYKRVTPQQGSGVFFESMRFHASCNPCVSQHRYAINFNFN
jgi:hypothetical protein